MRAANVQLSEVRRRQRRPRYLHKVRSSKERETIVSYWELAAWIAAAVCFALALRYRYLYLIAQKEIQIYNQLIGRIDAAFGRMHLSLMWISEPQGGQWEVVDELTKPRYGPASRERLAADKNWTVALQNAVNARTIREANDQSKRMYT
jgi:hypothetical protein